MSFLTRALSPSQTPHPGPSIKEKQARISRLKETVKKEFEDPEQGKLLENLKDINNLFSDLSCEIERQKNKTTELPLKSNSCSSKLYC